MIISDSAIGRLAFLFTEKGELTQVTFVRNKQQVSAQKSVVADKIVAYCSDASVDLSDIKFIQNGTKHQKAVWDYILTIPKGEVRTYSEVSAKVGGSPRSVANALRRNPLPILFPCHRVVAKSGIGGFSGDTKGTMINIKRHLLCIEGADVA